MKKPVYLFVLSLFLASLACSLPGVSAVGPTATASSTPAVETLMPPSETAIPASETALPATQTSLPPAELALPPTATRIPGPPVILSQFNMLNVNDGWGWASKDGNSNQLLRTTDGGQSWLDVSPPGTYVYFGSFFLDSQTAWLLFFKSESNTGGMLRTTDGGKNWTSLPSNDALINAWVQFSNQNDGVAQTAGVGAGNAYLNYYQTHDGGVTWSPILITPPNPEPGLQAGTVHLCNICGDNLYYDPARIIINSGDLASDPVGEVRLSVSTDLGAHWKKIELPLPDPKYASGLVAPISPVFFGNQGLLPVNIIKYNQDGSLAFSVLVIYTTQDGGLSWQAAPAVLENLQGHIDTVQMLSASDAFVRCGKNLCSTNDGAQTWRSLSSNLNFDTAASSSDYINQFHFVDPANGWAISGDSGATTLWKTSDGGASWTKLTPALAQ